MFILQCTLGLQSQSIEFKNFLSQADIPSGEPVFIELPRDFKSDGVQCDVVLRLKKIIICQKKSARLLYERLWNGFFLSRFLVGKVDRWLFISMTVICVVCVDDCLFWARSQSDIDNVMKSFKKYDGSYNWERSKGDSVSEFLGIDIKALDDGGL